MSPPPRDGTISHAATCRPSRRAAGRSTAVRHVGVRPRLYEMLTGVVPSTATNVEHPRERAPGRTWTGKRCRGISRPRRPDGCTAGFVPGGLARGPCHTPGGGAGFPASLAFRVSMKQSRKQAHLDSVGPSTSARGPGGGQTQRVGLGNARSGVVEHSHSGRTNDPRSGERSARQGMPGGRSPRTDEHASRGRIEMRPVPPGAARRTVRACGRCRARGCALRGVDGRWNARRCRACAPWPGASDPRALMAASRRELDTGVASCIAGQHRGVRGPSSLTPRSARGRRTRGGGARCSSSFIRHVRRLMMRLGDGRRPGSVVWGALVYRTKRSVDGPLVELADS